MKTALVAGATGLIGKQLVDLLLADDAYTVVKAVTRKALNINHPKLENIVIEFDTMTEHKELLIADDVFCCLGTTIRQVKTKEKFRKVDFEYPLALARIAKENGATQFLLISALGADKKSGIFYNQVKGDVEEAIAAVGFDAYHIFRPSLLLGDRTEHRSGEDAAKFVFKYVGFLVPEKYKGIESIKVALAMVAKAKSEKTGMFSYESRELQNY